ncbi:MAG: hypothetical protein K2P99_03705 [Burkholderiales bacterium]|nr:hypothetical protein [Burkholderiales bacterium]
MSSAKLFNTIPNKDYMHLFSADEVVGGNVAKILNYKKGDISVATKVPLSSIRYDDKMPSELKERLTEWAIAINLVAEFFRNEEKTVLWFSAINPLLGDVSPRDMIKLGRFKKLLKFIQTAIDENKR